MPFKRCLSFSPQWVDLCVQSHQNHVLWHWTFSGHWPGWSWIRSVKKKKKKMVWKLDTMVIAGHGVSPNSTLRDKVCIFQLLTQTFYIVYVGMSMKLWNYHEIKGIVLPTTNLCHNFLLHYTHVIPKPVWLSFVCGTQNKIFWTMLLFLSIQRKPMESNAVLFIQ